VARRRQHPRGGSRPRLPEPPRAARAAAAAPHLECPPPTRPRPPPPPAVCAPGHGIALPTRGTDGKPVKPTTAPECTKCAGNTVAGPDAPHVDWAQLGFVKREGRRHGAPGAPAPTTPAGGGRHLLGRGGKKAGLFCVPCPEGQEPNGDNTKCVPKSGP
jgi:hypothetical protein